MAIRLELPPVLLPQLRVRWHSVAGSIARRTRTLREFATRTAAVPGLRWRRFSTSTLAKMSFRHWLRERSLFRQQTQLQRFTATYDDLVDLLCGAAKEGLTEEKEMRYLQLRIAMRLHYRPVREPLRGYWQEVGAEEGYDPFTRLFLPATADEVIHTEDGIQTMMLTRCALESYQDALEQKLCRHR